MRLHRLRLNEGKIIIVQSEPDVDWIDHIPGGLADHANPLQFSPAALNKGIRVELEHTQDPEIAMEIAMDHLMEDPDYYEKLEEIHEDIEKVEGGWAVYPKAKKGTRRKRLGTHSTKKDALAQLRAIEISKLKG